MGLAFTAFWLDCICSRKKTSGKLCESRAFLLTEEKEESLMHNVYDCVKAFGELLDKEYYLVLGRKNISVSLQSP